MLMVTINVGLSFYAHTCQSSGHTSLLLSVDKDPCGMAVEMHVEKQADSCCTKPKNETEVKGKCCKTEQHVVQIENDYTQHATASLIQLAGNFVLPVEFKFDLVKSVYRTQEDFSSWYLAHAPPRLQGRQIHLVNEVYRN